MLLLAQTMVLLATALGPEDRGMEFHSRVRAPRSSTTDAMDTCYAAYARYSFLVSASVGTYDDDDKDSEFTTAKHVTLDQCKTKCEDGTWKGCIGFSRQTLEGKKPAVSVFVSSEVPPEPEYKNKRTKSISVM